MYVTVYMHTSRIYAAIIASECVRVWKSHISVKRSSSLVLVQQYPYKQDTTKQVIVFNRTHFLGMFTGGKTLISNDISRPCRLYRT